MTDRRIDETVSLLHELKPYAKTPEDISSNVEWLTTKGCHTWFFPYDGTASDPADYVRLMSALAYRCPHTALAFSMHAYTVLGLWPVMPEAQRGVLRRRIEEGALIGALNDPNLYFVQIEHLEFDRFPLRAVPEDGGYRVSGIKKYVSLEPFVSLLPIYALAEKDGKKRIVILWIDKHDDGIATIEDWDSIAMGGTFSNSLTFDGVFVPSERVLYDGVSAFSETALLSYFYRLNKAAVYLGMAQLALNAAETTCREKKVAHTGRALAFFPGAQFTLAEMIVLYETSVSQVMRLCELVRRCVANPAAASRDRETNVASLVTKQYVSKASETIVNLAMKIEGISSLSATNVLSSLYADVKAAQFHAPQPDVTAELIAKDRLGIVPVRNRWI